MYWGEGTIFAATSSDLVRWTPVEAETAPDRYLTWDPEASGLMGHWTLERIAGPQGLRGVAAPRRRRFDSLLVEPGPPALLTDHGIVLVYNGTNHPEYGATSSQPFAYQPGQMLFNARDPTAIVNRFLRIDPVEAAGQVGNGCFAQGLVAFDGRWRLYCGLADARMGVATVPIRVTTR